MESESCIQWTELHEMPWNYYTQEQIFRLPESVCLNLPLLPKPLASRLCEQYVVRFKKWMSKRKEPAPGGDAKGAEL